MPWPRSVGRIRRHCAYLACLATAAACDANPPLADGRWIGDLGAGDTARRLELVVDSAGRTIRVSAAAWGLSFAPGRRDQAGDSLRVIAVIEGDTLTLTGVMSGEHFTGDARRGDERLPFDVRRTRVVGDHEWSQLIGTYRTASGDLLGISRFDEMGPLPQIVDVASGRIGPLLAIDDTTYLVGRAIVAPLFPADTLRVRRSAEGGVTGVRLVGREGGPVDAARLATRDEPVTFRNGDVTLAGTLTLPDEGAPHPAIVLVHGSGPLTRDHIGPWQRFFPGLGFAVLGYDKRGTGASSGSWQEADFATLARDVLAAVELLAQRPDIRRDRIGLWGISQGGWILPLAVSIDPDRIAFMIVHAGTGTTVREQGILNLQYEYRFRGASEEEIAVVTQYRMLDDAFTRTGKGFEELRRFQETHASRAMLPEPAPPDSWFRPYYRMLMDFDPADAWTRVHIPVLLFFGELDANVPPRESWPPIERALARAGNRDVTHHVLPGANHLLLDARTGASDEYPHLSRFVGGYFDRMRDWLAVFR